MINTSDSNKTATTFNPESFAAIRAGEITAIVLDDIASSHECEVACRKLRILTEHSSYRWSTDLTILGVSVGEAHESPEALERYLTGAEQTVAIARDLIFAGCTPVDRITHRMMSIWQLGIRIPFFEGRPFLTQVLRRWKTGGGAHPHLDQSQTHLLRRFGIRRRFGLNVYLEMPTEGGAVEFWNRCLTDEEYENAKRPAPGYGLDRAFVGPADLKIRPRRGQAIIFDASKPHAVEAVGGEGERITNASFYAYSGEDNALFQFA